MNSTELARIAERLMSQPAAPYHEFQVEAEVRAICAEHDIPVESDGFGNLYARHSGGGRRAPMVLAAHMDHPGFEIIRRINSRRWLARFLGGVPDRYFQKGVGLRLHPAGTAATLGKAVAHKREKRFEIHATAVLKTAPKFAVWDLNDFALRRGRIRGRVCDDLVGVTAILATLIELKRRGAKTNVVGFISRAEEVGFHGALAAAAAGSFSPKSLLISLETSKEIPGVKMGEGVIVRVGDRSSVFDSAATRYLSEIAGAVQRRESGFKFQRALMAGGSCEGTAFQEFGLRTAAVCVALGNYHNCGPANQIAEEFVSLDDAAGMQGLLTEAAIQFGDYEAVVGRLPVRLNRLLREARRRLAK
jgi:putative aminopeptidase FrvX